MHRKKSSHQIWGEGADAPFPQGFDSGIRPPADPKDPSFVLYRDIHFWLIYVKTSLKTPLAPMYTNFEGGARAEKTRFFVRSYRKSA